MDKYLLEFIETYYNNYADLDHEEGLPSKDALIQNLKKKGKLKGKH